VLTHKVEALIVYEPGGYVFSSNDAPANLDERPAPIVRGSPQDFAKLARIPVLIIYGDNIPTEKPADPAKEIWRINYTNLH
jgi:hypothetical protein